VRADALADGSEETAALLKRLLAYGDVPRLGDVPSVDEAQEPVLAIHFRKGDVALKLFTTLATLGTPQDVTVQEIRVECFFPADAATADTFQAWRHEGIG
jgi:MmyB-like transcription regulator ligand binding domain